MLQKRFFLEPEFEDEAVFDLLAIHSPAEDFFLAYKLNEVLNSLLIKVIEEKDDDATHNTTSFNRFVWEQNSGDFVWELIANHFFYQGKKDETFQLFPTEIEKKSTLIRHLPKVDYFLKLPENSLTASSISAIQAINEVEIAYKITEPKVKLNPNLIFD